MSAYPALNRMPRISIESPPFVTKRSNSHFQSLESCLGPTLQKSLLIKDCSVRFLIKMLSFKGSKQNCTMNFDRALRELFKKKLSPWNEKLAQKLPVSGDMNFECVHPANLPSLDKLRDELTQELSSSPCMTWIGTFIFIDNGMSCGPSLFLSTLCKETLSPFPELTYLQQPGVSFHHVGTL